MKAPQNNIVWSSTKLWDVVEFLCTAEHTSILEHVNFTFEVTGVSRSFLAQITRHRMGSFTSSSQHYQDYRDYPASVAPEHEDPLVDLISFIKDQYIRLVDEGMPAEEARQVLPNAMTVHLLWTVNLRSLLNFCRQRCCNRNTLEMRVFANRIRRIICGIYPRMANMLGPACVINDACTQGHMQCKETYWLEVG